MCVWGGCANYIGTCPMWYPPPALSSQCVWDRQTDWQGCFPVYVIGLYGYQSIWGLTGLGWVVSIGVCHEVKNQTAAGAEDQKAQLDWSFTTALLPSQLGQLEAVWASWPPRVTSLGFPHSVVVSRQLDFLDSGWLLQNTHSKSSSWKLQGFLWLRRS